MGETYDVKRSIKEERAADQRLTAAQADRDRLDEKIENAREKLTACQDADAALAICREIHDLEDLLEAADAVVANRARTLNLTRLRRVEKQQSQERAIQRCRAKIRESERSIEELRSALKVYYTEGQRTALEARPPEEKPAPHSYHWRKSRIGVLERELCALRKKLAELEAD